jgi:uncharacterized protein YbjT (DUF2867 family)
MTRKASSIMATDPVVLVTGATGRVGRQVVTQLAQNSGVRIRALTRNPAAAAAQLDGKAPIEVVGGDLTDPGSLMSVLAGVEAVFLVFPSVAADHAAAALVAALAAEVDRIVYLSAAGVPDEPPRDGPGPDGTIMGSHAFLEGLLASSGTRWTFLRSSGFAANTLMWADQVRGTDTLRWFYGDARRALIHERDLAAVGVRALLDAGHDGERHQLTGPESLTQVEQLDAIGAAIGRRLHFEELDPDTAAKQLLAAAPPQVTRSILEAHASFVTQPEPVTDTVARVTGHGALSFARWARDHAVDFR